MDDGTVRVALPDGRTSSVRWDDIEAAGINPPADIVTADVAEQTHEMPEAWLRARVRGWMELSESPGEDFWIGTYTAGGASSRWIQCSSNKDRYVPMQHRVVMAREVCRALNKHCAHGGAWLTGWIRGGGVFYMLWKDPDGDIAVPIDCEKPFTEISKWAMEDWVRIGDEAVKARNEIYAVAEIKNTQQVKLAQGQDLDMPAQFRAAPKQEIL